MKCPTIQKITFSHESKKSLNEIKRINNLSKLLSTLMASGTLSTIYSNILCIFNGF